MPVQNVLVIDDSATILKVVQLVLSKAGYRVHGATSGEEGLKLATDLRPDVVLLDFVMPGMNGYQVCRAMSESETLRRVPVVLMSAKGEEVGERFVKAMGIVDYITKPFSPEAITAMVEQTIARYSARDGADERTHEVRLPSETDPNPLEVDGEEERTDSRPIVELASETAAADVAPTSGATARRRVLAALREAVALAAAHDDLVGDEIADRVRTRLTDEILERAAGRFLAAPPAADDRPANEVLAGELARVPIAQVLQLLDEQRQDGSLVVRRAATATPDSPDSPKAAEQRIELCFRGGKIDFAGGEGLGAEFLLGNYLLERHAISRHDLDLFFQSRRSSSRLFGEQLVQLNYITDDDLRHALARQTCERVYEVLRWSSGRFAFRAGTADPGPAASKAALQLPVEGILVEGLRRVDEWHLIEREIDDLDAIFLRSDEDSGRLASGALTRDEAAVLDLVNGRNSVRDIVRQSRMGNFDVSQLLYRLKSVHLIRRRVQPIAV